MSINFAKVLVVPKDYKEDYNPEILKTVQSIPCDIYFMDDVVSIKRLCKDVPVIGRISDINENIILLDCSKNFKKDIKEIKRDEIESIRMWDCPENVLVRKHTKEV